MVLSGSTDPRAIARAVNEAALFRYLLKPCTPSDLILAVDQALEAHLVQQGHVTTPRMRLDLDDVLAELQVQVQPIFGLDRGEIFAHECLLRLPERFHACPTDVLDVAEQQDRLWGVERAIRRVIAARIPERPDESLVFVNVHPKSLLDPELFDRRDPLASYAAAVVLEITERSALTDVPDLPDRVAALRRLGYRVAIDDLGSGYSGLTSFASLMPDFVKFDRELIQGIHEASAKRKLVQSFVTVCAGLGVQTIAEGVEDERDLAAIRLMGCGYVQGFLLARPAPAFFAPAYPGWRAARGTLAPVMASDVVGGWQS
jgi:EAL domain-containing protein (putative c-di-GMP-specific phosphodiesterase class I)